MVRFLIQSLSFLRRTLHLYVHRVYIIDHQFSHKPRNLQTYKNTHPVLESTLAGLLEAGSGKPGAENSLGGERETRSGISQVQEPA